MSERPPSKQQPYEYTHGHQFIAYEKNGRKLLVSHGLADRMRFPNPVATYAGPDAAEMDGPAFDILFRACGGESGHFDKKRFEGYLDAIIDFEIQHSDDEARHQNRLPIEEEILRVLTEGGYFKK